MERLRPQHSVEREIALAPEASEMSPLVGPQLAPKEYACVADHTWGWRGSVTS